MRLKWSTSITRVKNLRQADGTGNIKPRAVGRDVSDHAVDTAAAVKGKRAVLEHSVLGVTRFSSIAASLNTSVILGSNSAAELRAIESNIPDI